MKKAISFLAVVSCLAFANAQQWDGLSNTTGHIYRNGNVSIGTDSNDDKLNVAGNIRVTDGKGIHFGSIEGFGPYYEPLFQIKPFTVTKHLYLFPSTTFPLPVSTSVPIEYKAFVIGKNSRIGVGTDSFSCTSCTGYRLFVKDGIKTEKVKVEIAASNGWADYVFEKDYKLMPLNELEAFINTNKHLPEVPTTEEAIANGIELKEMNILLLKKVEELTLYTIEQNKQLKEQAERIEKLEQKINKN